MAQKMLDVVGIGNAIVDVIARADDAFLAAEGIAKGAMTLIDDARAQSLYAAMGPAIESSGGSAANTIAGLAALGAKTGYIGLVGNDTLGEIFRHDITALGAQFQTAAATDGVATAHCLILVTPDAQRSMNTFLGACVGLGPEHVHDAQIAAAKVVYLEGYLWDPPRAKEAFLKAATIAQQTGGKVALSLSDTFCVSRHRDSFLDLVRNQVDILFANEDELKALFETDDFDHAVSEIRQITRVAAITRGSQGAVILDADGVFNTAAGKVANVIDTTGAGDLFAAGFLHGYCSGADAATCGQFGNIVAAEVISHFGARPEADLKALVQGVTP